MEPVMLRAVDLTDILKRHTAFIMNRGIRAGHKGEALLDFLAQVALELWRDRYSWPENVESELALIRKHADATAIDMMRRNNAKKRRGVTVSLSRDNGSDPAHGCPALQAAPLQEDLLDIARIRHAIYIVAATLTPELERIVVARLKNDGGDAFSKNENQRALRAFRKAISLPPETPQDARVSDPADHLIRSARAIEAESAGRAARKPKSIDNSQEITCADAIWTNSRESGSLKSREHHGTSGIGLSPNRTLWSATAAAVNATNATGSTLSEIESDSGYSARSQPPRNGSGRCRRPAHSGLTSTTGPIGGRRPEPTLVTRHEMFEEASSESRSSG
jgi:hypothetical protein